VEDDRLKVNMAKARARFPEIVKLVEDGAIVRVDRYSKPVAVILSFEKFEEIEEDLEDLKAVVLAMREGRTEPGVSWEEYLQAQRRMSSAG
jgi:prevent-host-death family protein